MEIKISRISAILLTACITLTQLPYVFAVIKQTDWIPLSAVIIPLELVAAIGILMSAFYLKKSLIVISVVFLLLVSVDLYTSFFGFVEFLNPFAETKYYKIVPVSPETIRFPNRDLTGLFVAVLASLVVISSKIWVNRITKGSN